MKYSSIECSLQIINIRIKQVKFQHLTIWISGPNYLYLWISANSLFPTFRILLGTELIMNGVLLTLIMQSCFGFFLFSVIWTIVRKSQICVHSTVRINSFGYSSRVFLSSFLLHFCCKKFCSSC